MADTPLRAIVKDAAQNPLTGYIRITLSYDLNADDGSTHTTVPAIVPLVAGVATFTLAPSEVARITYKFEYINSAVTPAIVVKEFYATVPASTTEILLSDLEPTGITHDAQDGSLTAIARRLYNSDQFWARFQDSLLNISGAYDPNAWYQRGSLVFYQGGTYCYINRIASTGIAPIAGNISAYWSPMALPGQTVVGALDPAILATLATKTDLNAKVSAANANLSNPVLTGATITDNLPLTDNSNKAAYTAWVNSVLADVKKRLHNVGDVIYTVATSAPQYWISADGRVVSRSTYGDLFNLIGTAFNVGGESGSQFRLPDLRGRMILGLDNISGITGAANRVASANAIGANGGAATKTLSTAEMPAHDHGGSTGIVNSQTPSGNERFFDGSGTGGLSILSTSPVGTVANSYNRHTHGIPSQGGGAAFSIMPPYIALLPLVFTGV